MKKTILLSLLSIVLIAVVLFGVSFGLNGIANQNAQKEHLRIMQTLLPDSETFTVEPYTGDDANIRSVHKGETGFIVEAATYGYAGEIEMLIAVSNDGEVVGLVVRDMHETPGLGRNALTDWQFLSQYLKTTGDAQVDTISGATVTTKAITRCVNSAAAYVTGTDIDSAATSWGG